MPIETQIIEVTTTDRAFLCRLIDWLSDADAEESSTVVRLRDGHAAFTEDELTRLHGEVARLKLFIRDRVKCNLLRKHGGYHGRRVYMEAEKLLRELEPESETDD